MSRAWSAMLQIQEKPRTLSRHDDTHTHKVENSRSAISPKAEVRKMKRGRKAVIWDDKGRGRWEVVFSLKLVMWIHRLHVMPAEKT